MWQTVFVIQKALHNGINGNNACLSPEQVTKQDNLYSNDFIEQMVTGQITLKTECRSNEFSERLVDKWCIRLKFESRNLYKYFFIK